MADIANLEPKGVWKLFDGMTRVPRPSKKEDRIREHITKVAGELGLKVRRDEPGNLLVEAPASPGCEGAAPTLLQGHLDMVCEANSDVRVDFDRDPITTLMDTEGEEPIVRAKGTTLGADNGIGVCMALAAASSPDVRHGPLEILLTFDEEAGMTGAKAVAPGFFRSRRMINLDSEEDDAIYIGCAGGTDTNLTWQMPLEAAPVGGEVVRVSVSGLKGGHSGSEIHLNRGNAIKLLTRVLLAADRAELRIADITGGSKRNAIPREASATVIGPKGTMSRLAAAAEKAQSDARAHSDDARAAVRVEAGGDGTKAVAPVGVRRFIETLSALPQGVLAVVPEIPGLVQTSNNVSTIVAEAGGGGLRVVVGCLSRSSSAIDIAAALRQIASAGRLGGAEVTTANEYPGWQPNVDSATLGVCRGVYERLFGTAPRVAAIHAGLECGIIGQRVGGMDMVSFGPHIEGAHSPDERVYVRSVQKSWRYLVAVLDALAKG